MGVKKPSFYKGFDERVTGIEPVLTAWKAEVLPLNYTRDEKDVSWKGAALSIKKERKNHQTKNSGLRFSP